MDRFKQIETFVDRRGEGQSVCGGAGRGRRAGHHRPPLDALEERLGVKLLVRTTRKITLTFEGSAFLEDCQRVINDMQNAEASVSAGGVKASGHLRRVGAGGLRAAPRRAAGAGIHVAHPDVSITLDLSDRMVDLVNEGFDCAVRLGELPDSSLVSLKLGENRRVCVASPAYLARRGAPHNLADLAQHNCLALGASAEPAARLGVPAGRQGRDDQGVRHDGMLGRRGAARVVSRRAMGWRGARGGKSATISRPGGS